MGLPASPRDLATFGNSIDITRIRYKDFKDLLWYLIFIKHVNRDLLALIVIVAWCMWFYRNKTRLGNPRQPSREILHKACLILEEFQLAHFRKPHHRQAQDSSWVPSTYSYYKINADAAIFNNSVGIGIVVRDHEGSVTAAMSKHLQLPLGPLEAEAKAMEEAISFAWDIGVRDVIFETNCSTVSEALNGSTTPPVTIVNLIMDVHHRLQDFR
ncbi:uncharacterized protein LOC142640285 [Castanea sativa]|uniref:uncharacterized protein LOC142640285 n=1 Tax=Castanea sativa TaxID=21020 RepID=UPI003F64AD4D